MLCRKVKTEIVKTSNSPSPLLISTSDFSNVPVFPSVTTHPTPLSLQQHMEMNVGSGSGASREWELLSKRVCLFLLSLKFSCGVIEFHWAELGENFSKWNAKLKSLTFSFSCCWVRERADFQLKYFIIYRHYIFDLKVTANKQKPRKERFTLILCQLSILSKRRFSVLSLAWWLPRYSRWSGS